MVGLEYLKKIINKRPIIIMLHGKSIEGLENNIQSLKNLDICYTSLNYFDLLENNILSKIDKRLSFVYDSSGIVPKQVQYYEGAWRIPRLKKYLNRPDNNLWITTKGLIKIIAFDTYNEDFIVKYWDKIMIAGQLNIRLNVPNSAVLLIGLCILGEASKIAICGLDGFTGQYKDNLQSFYKYEEYKKHRFAATGDYNYTGIVQDTQHFQNETISILNKYACDYKIKMPPIINFSTKSIYNIFSKKDYNELVKWIK